MRILNDCGYEVVPTSSGDEALQVFKNENARFDLLITDMVMPGQLQGPALAGAIREIKPGFAVIFISGYSDARIHTLSNYIQVKKPVKSAELINAIELVKKQTMATTDSA